MKIKNWVYTLALGVAMFMCGASYADQYSTSMDIKSPAGGNDFNLVTWPPLAPANKPVNDGFDHVVTASDNDEIDATYNYMGSCHVNERTYNLTTYYRTDVDHRIPETVLACGYESKIDKPMKVPIRV